MDTMPDKITVRVITKFAAPSLGIEHDGQPVDEYHKFPEVDGEVCMKAAELAFASLGYVPDLDRMYMDDALMVLHMHRQK